MEQIGAIIEGALVNVDAQRLQTMVDIEEIRVRAVQDVLAAGEDAIDHFFVRLTQLLVVAGAIFLLAGWLLMRRFAPRPAT